MNYFFVIPLLFLSINSCLADSEFVHCYDFGCKSTQDISFDNEQWASIKRIFSALPLSPWLEKQQIRQAIALMETYAGQLTGSEKDQGGNYNGSNLTFQQDCIDESTNTYQYLQALQRRELLQWHRVAQKKRRIVWFVTHWTAVIQQNISGESYAVDSWYRDNGEPPYIQRLEEWQRKAAFSDSLNP